jgi:hypothetical protein
MLMVMIAKILTRESSPRPEDLAAVEQSQVNVRGRKRARDDSDKVTPPTKRTEIELRPRKRPHYKRCVSSIVVNAFHVSEREAER